MAAKGKNNGLKITLGIIVLLLLASAYYSYTLRGSAEQTKITLTKEKQAVLVDLRALETQYDEALKGNSIMSNELQEARDRISALVDSLESSENDVKNLFYYRKKFFVLQKEMDELLKENELLKLEKEQLLTSLDSTQLILVEQNKYTDSLLIQNTDLSKAVKDASALRTIGLKGMGVIERNSGKQIPTERARRSDKLKICYTVLENTLATAGDKAFYVQVIDPKNNVLGLNKQVSFNQQTLNYSFISQFNYINENLILCDYISKDEDKFEKGIYYISVFNEDQKLATTQFTLR